MNHGYQVFCAGSRKGSRWVPYSRKFTTQEEAQTCLHRAEGYRTCDLKTDELLRYKIKEVSLD